MTDAAVNTPQQRWVPFAIAGAAVLAYANTLPADFVYDDFPFIVNNPAIHTLEQPWKFLVDRSAMSEGGFYTILRPLSSWIWSITWVAVGNQPAAFHAVNVIMHALASLCVWRLAYTLGLRRGSGALWAALVFALHPVQTEAVAWVAGLGNPLHVIGVTSACAAYVRWRAQTERQVDLARFFAWFTFGLLGKEHAVALPLLLVAIECVPTSPSQRSRGQRAAVVSAAFVLVALYVIWRNTVLGQTAQTGYWGGSLYATVLTMLNAFREYVRLLWWPTNLHPEYIVPIATAPRAPGVMLSAAVLASVAGVAAIIRQRAAVAALGIVWFFFALAPVSNVIPLKAIMNERLMYLAVVGFGLVLGSILQLAHTRRTTLWARALLFALVVQLGAFSALTVVRNQDWRDSERLWTAAVESEPRGYTSHYNLGVVYAGEGDLDSALRHLNLAVELRGPFPQAHGAIGNIHVQQGDYPAAIATYRRGLIDDSSNVMLRNNLLEALFAHGNTLRAAGKTASAQGAYQDMLRIAPDHAGALEALATLEAEPQA